MGGIGFFHGDLYPADPPETKYEKMRWLCKDHFQGEIPYNWNENEKYENHW